MRALVTGASSGIGRDIAKELASRGYEVILVARNIDKLNEVKSELENKATIIQADLRDRQKCEQIVKDVGYVDILVNAAGFGVFGEFDQTDLDKELDLIDTNVTALHILTKLFLKEMVKKNSGYILNVASIAGHMPGPLMATYYASKAYVVRLSQSINYEMKKKGYNVKVGILSPGPVNTNFNNVAGVKFNLKSLSSNYVARYTVDKMLKGKVDITPGVSIKFARFFAKIIPANIMAIFTYKAQDKKRN